MADDAKRDEHQAGESADSDARSDRGLSDRVRRPWRRGWAWPRVRRTISCARPRRKLACGSTAWTCKASLPSAFQDGGRGQSGDPFSAQRGRNPRARDHQRPPREASEQALVFSHRGHREHREGAGNAERVRIQDPRTLPFRPLCSLCPLCFNSGLWRTAGAAGGGADAVFFQLVVERAGLMPSKRAVSVFTPPVRS